jgi:DNA invertase Pin-like site-specific DNA recombinase
VSGVVIHKIDRSARNLKDWSDLGDVIDQGIEVHFANEMLDLNSRGGRLSADIQAVVASDYIRNLREETIKGMYGRLKQGFYPIRAPIGYCDNGAAKSKTIDPEKGPLVRKAFELYASGRFPIVPLVEELYRIGLRNHNGGKVTRNGLSTLLNNPFYVGLIRIRTRGEIYQGNHEPLISKRLFEQVQKTLQGRLNKRTKVHEFQFRRMMTCKTCGYSLVGETRKGYVYYRCQTRDCPTTAIREESVCAVVESNLKRLEFSDAERTYLLHATSDLKKNWIAESDRQSAALKMNVQQIAERLKRLTDAYIDQALEKELFEERKTALLLERRSVEEQLGHLNEGRQSVPEILQKFLGLADKAYFLYKIANPERKRQMVKIVTSDLSLCAKNLEFTFAPAFQAVAERETNTNGRPHKVVARTCDALLTSLIGQVSSCVAVADEITLDEVERNAV